MISNGILDASKTVENKIILAGNNIKDNIMNGLINFGNVLSKQFVLRKMTNTLNVWVEFFAVYYV